MQFILRYVCQIICKNLPFTIAHQFATLNTVGISAGIESHRTLRDELYQWNLEEIVETFEKEHVTIPIMWDFNDEELKELGVGLVQRKKYFSAKEHFKTKPIEKVTLLF